MIRIPILVIATATALLATGCNMGEVATSSSPAAVKVNGDTISVDAIRTELAARNLPPEQAGAAEAHGDPRTAAGDGDGRDGRAPAADRLADRAPRRA